MRCSTARILFVGLAVFVAGVACLEPLTLDETPTTAVAVGETRTVELRYLRFDVTNFEQTLTKQDLRELPQEVQNRLWMLDLDLSNSQSSPHLLDNSLVAIRNLDPNELDGAAQNMQRLLNMTPDTANLEGTSFEDIIDLGPLIGVSSARVLADMVGVDVEDTFLTTEAVTRTILEQVISTHPNAQFRPGPRTPDNPEGVYPVTPESLPITLADAASDFATLADRFGPVFVDGVYHPGFIVGEARSRVLGDDFQMTVRANANALPFKGVDLTDTSIASVNSVASQIDTLFDFNDPDWLVIEGLVEGVPTIEELTFTIVEADGFLEGGRSPVPNPYGSSPAWRLPPWTLERVVLGSALRSFEGIDSRVEYFLPSGEDPAMILEVEDGWAEVFTAGGLGSPPPPSYIWDVLLEVAQVRLHDGGIPEGEADVQFTLTDVPVGIDTEDISQTIRENLEADPTSLVDVASLLIDTTVGDADFYYYRPDVSNPEEIQGDYLYFITEDDIAIDDEGLPIREYSYDNPGFYEDAELTQRASSTVEIDGDVTHEKVRISPGDVLYVEDDEGAVFEIVVGDKPSESRVSLRSRVSDRRGPTTPRRAWAAVVALVALLTWSGTVSASGLHAPNVGHGLSSPVRLDASSIYWNPGMIGFLDSLDLVSGGGLIIGDVVYQRDRRAIYQQEDSFDFALPIEPDLIDPGRSGVDEQVRANPIGLAPDFFLTVPLSDTGVVGGLGIYAPYAAIIDFPDSGPQRYALQEATILTTYISAALAWAPNDIVSFGITGAYVFGLAELSKILDMASLTDLGTALENDPINQENDFGPDAPPAVRELDVLSRPIRITRAIGGGFAFMAGVGIRPSESVRLGLSYHHSVPMTFRGDFQLDMDDEFFTQDLASQGLQYDPLVEGDASIAFTLPSSLNIGVGYELSERIGLDLVTSFIRYSTVDAFDVRTESEGLAQPDLGLPPTASIALPRDWQDVLYLELTMRHNIAPERFTYWITTGYHSPASPESTIDAASPDGQWFVFAIGGVIELTDQLNLILDAEVQRTANRRIEQSDYDLGNGDYQMTLVNLGTHLNVSW